MKNIIGYTDTITLKEYRFPTFGQMAAAVVKLSQKERDWARYLPFCNGWNLDYPEAGETAYEYHQRMVDMAIGLQLIG